MSQFFRLIDFLARSTDDPFDETELAKVLRELPSLRPEGPWLAGGALRRTLLGRKLESDFDFFFRDEAQLAAFASELEAKGLSKARETEHHVHYRGRLGDSGPDRDIQCIRFAYYADATAVIDSFDFTICQFAFDGGTLTCGDYALFDLGRKRLAVHRITYPVATMRRLLKYGRQGFMACNGALAQILTQTAKAPEIMARVDIAYVD